MIYTDRVSFNHKKPLSFPLGICITNVCSAWRGGWRAWHKQLTKLYTCKALGLRPDPNKINCAEKSALIIGNLDIFRTVPGRNCFIALITSHLPKGKQKVFLTQTKTKFGNIRYLLAHKITTSGKWAWCLTLSQTLEADSSLPGYYCMFSCLSKQNSQ